MVEPWRKEKKNFFLPSLCSSVFHLLFFYDRWIVRTIICKLIVERNSWSRFFERWFKHSISIFSLLLNYHDCIYKYVDKFREPGEWALNSQNFTLSLSLSLIAQLNTGWHPAETWVPSFISYKVPVSSDKTLSTRLRAIEDAFHEFYVCKPSDNCI